MIDKKKIYFASPNRQKFEEKLEKTKKENLQYRDEMRKLQNSSSLFHDKKIQDKMNLGPY